MLIAAYRDLLDRLQDAIAVCSAATTNDEHSAAIVRVVNCSASVRRARREIRLSFTWEQRTARLLREADEVVEIFRAVSEVEVKGSRFVAGLAEVGAEYQAARAEKRLPFVS